MIPKIMSQYDQGMFANTGLNAMPAANHPNMTSARPRAILRRRDRGGCMPHTLPRAEVLPPDHLRAHWSPPE
ncbi:hypothetical protein Pmi06nite_49180 [Planotetraspora mira]|uniref:Uncharacterized protein n=1 Tax=Planotetraspora mira TaxID=58121 RepID=A0A8J3X8N5_9ACTN|nr:hypothetical protein Pmi06nite_49180 [Planotetraspora mira]